MLIPRWIYWLLLFYIITAVYAQDDEGEENECDADDLECLQDITTSISSTSGTTSSFVTSSSFSFGEPSSTVSAASSDILSDFHEAKLVKPKPNNPNIPTKPDTLKPIEDSGSSFQDNINQDHDLGSSGDGMPAGAVGDDNRPPSALSNIEAGILSACGILVVAGVAVGIFVWKNTTRRRNLRRNHELPMVDIERSNKDDRNDDGSMVNSESMEAALSKEILSYDGAIPKQLSFESMKYLSSINLPLPAFDRDDFFSNWQRRNGSNNSNTFEYEPKQKSPIAVVISEQTEKTTTTTILDNAIDTTFQIPAFEHTLFTSEDEPVLVKQDASISAKVEEVVSAVAAIQEDVVQPNSVTAKDKSVDDDYIITANHLRNSVYGPMFTGGSPNIEANRPATRPSALDPAYDPTALTYPLQKFLQTPPLLQNSSPMQISVNLGSDDDDDEEQESNTTNSRQQQQFHTPQLQQTEEVTYSKEQASTHNLGQQLNKLFRHPSTDPTHQQAENSYHTMVEIDLHEDPTRKPQQQQNHHAMTPKLDNHMLEKIAKEPLPTFDENTKMTLSNLEKAYRGLEEERKARYFQENPLEKGPAQLFIEDYKERYLAEHGKPFMSPLDLPDDQYVPLRDQVGPPLVSRAEVLADPVRRLGEDEIALWEESCRKKELKRLSYEMWDEQMLREEIEEYDRKHIACYYGNPEEEYEEPAVNNTAAVVPTLPAVVKKH